MPIHQSASISPEVTPMHNDKVKKGMLGYDLTMSSLKRSHNPNNTYATSNLTQQLNLTLNLVCDLALSPGYNPDMASNYGYGQIVMI